MPQAKLTASSPVLLVKDVLKAADYYRDKLGFTDVRIYNEPPDFAIVERDGFSVMLAQVEHHVTVTPNWKIQRSTWNIYFRVDDIDAIYEEFQNSGAIIDYTLHTKPYGMREFGVQDLDGHDIAIGQVI
jgi:uncharacterized glyoxalase superfamily protein PhnB